MRTILLYGILFLSLFSFSCKMQYVEGKEQEKETSSKQVRNAIDSGKYVDFTMKSITPGQYSIESMVSLSNGTFSDGKNTIKIEKVTEKVTVFLSDVSIPDRDGVHQIEYSFQSKLVRASDNCGYLSPVSSDSIVLNIDGVRSSPHLFKNFSFLIPLHGFGENRLEVSSVLKDRILISGGTFWKKK